MNSADDPLLIVILEEMYIHLIKYFRLKHFKPNETLPKYVEKSIMKGFYYIAINKCFMKIWLS